VRWRGLHEAAAALGLSVRRVGPHEPTTAAGARAAERVATSRATAVIAYDDALAIGLSRGLARLGVDVPRDVSVLGFDGTALAAMVDPPLTTVSAPLAGLGRAGVRLCLDLAAGARTDLPTTVLPVTLVQRASTAPPRAVSPVRRSRAQGQLPATARSRSAALPG
jgi:LacI family transcriptional regulator